MKKVFDGSVLGVPDALPRVGDPVVELQCEVGVFFVLVDPVVLGLDDRDGKTARSGRRRCAWSVNQESAPAIQVLHELLEGNAALFERLGRQEPRTFVDAKALVVWRRLGPLLSFGFEAGATPAAAGCIADISGLVGSLFAGQCGRSPVEDPCDGKQEVPLCIAEGFGAAVVFQVEALDDAGARVRPETLEV